MPSPGGEGLFCSMYKHNQTSKPHKGYVGQPLFLTHYIEAGNSAKGRPVTASSQDPDPQELTLLPQLEVLAYKQAYGLAAADSSNLGNENSWYLLLFGWALASVLPMTPRDMQSMRRMWHEIYTGLFLLWPSDAIFHCLASP
ncbi:putative Serine Carboxypeptidase Cpvl [Manis pentadactyla]|nr:putative Serine Carboxypeptidase Cpvl [Manis pentadactyla]